MTITYSGRAERSIKRLRKTDRSAYDSYKKLLPLVEKGEGKVMAGWTPLAGCRSLRSGKFRLVYVPGSPPEIVLAGYRKNVYHANCDN